MIELIVLIILIIWSIGGVLVTITALLELLPTPWWQRQRRPPW